MNAEAFTLRSDVAFAEGRYRPDSEAGRRLLAHELAHVIQQGQAAPLAGKAAMAVQRREVGRIARAESPAAPAAAFRQKGFVVRDASIGLGGTLVQDLADFKRQVMQLKNPGKWTLVLAIHGSQD